MTSAWTPRFDHRHSHLRLLGGAEPAAAAVSHPQPRPTAQERRVMSQVAARLRRSAARLPEHSPLRAELLETAEYYALGADASADAEAARRSRAG